MFFKRKRRIVVKNRDHDSWSAHAEWYDRLLFLWRFEYEYGVSIGRTADEAERTFISKMKAIDSSPTRTMEI